MKVLYIIVDEKDFYPKNRQYVNNIRLNFYPMYDNFIIKLEWLEECDILYVRYICESYITNLIACKAYSNFGLGFNDSSTDFDFSTGFNFDIILNEDFMDLKKKTCVIWFDIENTDLYNECMRMMHYIKGSDKYGNEIRKGKRLNFYKNNDKHDKLSN